MLWAFESEPAIAAMHGLHSLVHAVIRPARFGNCDPIGKPRMIHRQTSYDSAVLTEDTGVVRSLPIDGYQRNRV